MSYNDEKFGDLDAPASNAYAITPDDDNDLPKTTRAIHVGSDGTLDVIMLGGGEVSFVVKEGVCYPYRVKRVLETSSATNLIALV